MLCWNLPSGPKHRIWLQKKTVLSLKGISSLSGEFVLIWMKQRLIWFNIQRDGTRNGLSNIKETFAENLQLKISSSLRQSMSIFQEAGLSNSYDCIWWLGKINVKKRYLMCQIPIKMLKQRATPNSVLHNLKTYSSEGCRKTSQRWIYVASYLPTYLVNTAVLDTRFFSRRYHFKL